MNRTQPEPKALLFVLSGPAGSGKTTLCANFLATHPQAQRVITTTSRQPRTSEVDGRDYHFLTPSAFGQQITQGAFYEYTQTHGHYYGTYKSEIQHKLEKNIDLFLLIDVKGVAQLRQFAQQDSYLVQRMITIFILPPNAQVLEQRLQARGDSTTADIEARLQTAQAEITHWPNYDYCLPTGTKIADLQCLEAIYRAEKLRVRKCE